MSFTLTTCADKAQWDRFVSESPQGNAFCLSPFLDALGEDYGLFFVEEGCDRLLGAVLVKRDGQPVRAPYAATMYQGVLFGKSCAELPAHSRVKLALELMDFLLAELERRYDRISFCLHPRFEDLRSILWFHHHEPHLGQFKIEVRYSGIVDLAGAPDFASFLASIRKTRRYEYRKAASDGLAVEVSQDVDTLDRLHRLTFERQGMERGEEAGRLLRSMTTAALARGFGELLICRGAEGEAISSTLFLYDQRCAYYLYGANHPSYRDTNGGTFLMLENIRRCQARGLKWVDVCGINSPNRGHFKTSFNAVPVPYFVVTWERPGLVRE